jgi:hypothetical protein
MPCGLSDQHKRVHISARTSNTSSQIPVKKVRVVLEKFFKTQKASGRPIVSTALSTHSLSKFGCNAEPECLPVFCLLQVVCFGAGNLSLQLNDVCATVWGGYCCIGVFLFGNQFACYKCNQFDACDQAALFVLEPLPGESVWHCLHPLF